jgi:hypothetical protein
MELFFQLLDQEIQILIIKIGLNFNRLVKKKKKKNIYIYYTKFFIFIILLLKKRALLTLLN